MLSSWMLLVIIISLINAKEKKHFRYDVYKVSIMEYVVIRI